MKKFLIALLFSVSAFAQVNISPNMGFPIPIPGLTPGPDWANNIDAALTAIDSHNHSPGQGVQISPNGMNINTDLGFNSNNAVLLRTTRYSPQLATLTGPSDIGALYVVGNELYYNDVTGGNQIQITVNGSVNAGAGSITGLPSGTASASFSAGTFIWQSATNTAANMDFGSAILRNSTASSKGLTLNPPAAMASNITETLPTIPVQKNIMSMDTSGNMAADVNVDNTTIQLSSNLLGVIPASIGTIYLTNLNVTTAKIADGAVTLAKLDSTILTWNISTFTSSGTFTVPANVNRIYIEAIGAGGGGGGGSNSNSGTVLAGGGGGGGSGGVNKQWVTVTPAESLTVTIGAAGTAGTAAMTVGNSGGAGGDTSLKRSTTILVYAVGGAGGGGGSRTGSGPGNLGGTGGGNPTAGVLGPGAAGVVYAQQVAYAGLSGGNGGGGGQIGGAGSSGSGFYQYSTTGGTGGNPGTDRGAGGGGGASPYGNGGNGTNGGSGTAGAGGLGAGGGGGGAEISGAAGGGSQMIIYWLGHS